MIVKCSFDSVKLNDISGKLTVLDTSIHNSNDRLLEGISRGNDTLIDSMRKYLNSLVSRVILLVILSVKFMALWKK